MRLSVVSATTLVVAAVFVAGCTTTPPQPDSYSNSIRSIGLLSTLPADAKAVRIGLTVFNNDSRQISMSGEPTAIVLSEIEARLSKSKQNWVLQRISASALNASTSETSLAAVAKSAGVDAVLAVLETRHDAGGGSGVGVFVRALPGLKPYVVPHGVISIWIIDKNGNRLASVATGVENQRPKDIGFSGDMKELDDLATLLRVKQAIREALHASTVELMVRLGY